MDGDGVGDVCDDDDQDGLLDVDDNCPQIENLGQADCDGDGVGDACDDEPDGDEDGHADECDNCPDVANPDQANGERDGAVDAHGDACDVCPEVFDPDQADCDADGIGDACDEQLPDDVPECEGVLPAGCDLDRDGYANAGCDGTDCDDEAPEVHPEAEDICHTGIDEDCSGQADEGCPPPPCEGDLWRCIPDCQGRDNFGCAEGCFQDAGRACRECMNAAELVCWSPWCEAETQVLLDCREAHGCEDMVWFPWIDNCVSRNCAAAAAAWFACTDDHLDDHRLAFADQCQPRYTLCGFAP